MAIAPFYRRHGADADDLQTGSERGLPTERTFGREIDGVALTVASVHLANLAISGDATLVLNGQIAGERPPRSKAYVGNRRSDSIDAHRHARTRRRRWARCTSTVRDTLDQIGDMDCIAGSNLGLNATVVSPHLVTGELDMLADCELVLQGGLTGAGDTEMRITADSAVTMLGNQVHGGILRMVGDATIRMKGTGGTDASEDPTKRRGGLVGVAVRGGRT